jgi:hypothetical protein
VTASIGSLDEARSRGGTPETLDWLATQGEKKQKKNPWSQEV